MIALVPCRAFTKHAALLAYGPDSAPLKEGRVSHPSLSVPHKVAR
jgi:hypothetical protein